MIILIATITVILYIILISFTIHNLSLVENKNVKIVYIILGLVVMLISTWITFQISASGINYTNNAMVGNVRNILLAVFVPVNGLVTMPYMASMLSKIGTNEITQEKFKKRIIILAVIFLAVLIFECSYFKSTQIGIIKMLDAN